MRDLFTTIGTRYLIAILNLALIFVNAKVLGVEGVGLVGLILAIVGIATMFCGILAGNKDKPASRHGRNSSTASVVRHAH